MQNICKNMHKHMQIYVKIWTPQYKICRTYANHMQKYAIHMHKYAKNMQKYAINM